MTTTKKRYDWANKLYVCTQKHTNAAGQPTAQCGPYNTQPEADAALVKRRGKTGDETLLVIEKNINTMNIRPTRVDDPAPKRNDEFVKAWLDAAKATPTEQ